MRVRRVPAVRSAESEDLREIPRWALCGLLSALLLIVGQASAGAQGGDEFTVEERRALAAGELVTRPMERQAGHLDLIGGSAWQVINAPPAIVFRALLDTPRYPRMMPQVVEARRVEGPRASPRTIFMRQGAGPIGVSYYLNVRVDRERRDIRFRMDTGRPHDLRAAWGSYSVRAYPGGRTLLAYGVMADLGRGMLRVLVRETVHVWMLKVPWTVKRFVEGSGRWVYNYEPPSLGVRVEAPSGPTRGSTDGLSAAR
ncbi:MAG: SRPBCC family protein [Myxococcales bacterium]|nr:SRPBCC family protein [Myxococcales bacterium]